MSERIALVLPILLPTLAVLAQDPAAQAGREAQQDIARTRVDPAKMTAQAAVTAFASVMPGGGWMAPAEGSRR